MAVFILPFGSDALKLPIHRHINSPVLKPAESLIKRSFRVLLLIVYLRLNGRLIQVHLLSASSVFKAPRFWAEHSKIQSSQTGPDDEICTTQANDCGSAR